MSVAYNFKVNFALGSMCIDPSRLNATWAAGLKEIGKSSGLKPEETALAIASFAFEGRLDIPDAVELAIGVWKKAGKIRLSEPEVLNAIERLGYSVRS